ncbi:hypothetical protein GCM10009619_20770 [Williamsia maris]
MRWVARRPPEARPGPRLRRSASAGPTPRYTWIPRWGLVDEIAAAPEPTRDRTARWAQALTPMVQTLATLLAVTAIAQAWIYGLLVVNRSEPLNGTLVAWSYAITWGLGVVSVAMVIACLVAFVAWLRHHRERAYADNDRIDPRPRWHLTVGTIVPVLNLVAPAVFVHELASCGHQLPADRLVRTLRLWWAGWVALNLLAAITLTIRFTADSIQWGANAVLLTVLCDAAGAVFALVSIRLLHRAFDPAARPEPTTRWLAA